MRERKALRDLVIDEAAARGIAREKVWEWACLAIVRGELSVELPDRASLETRLYGATTYRDLIGQAVFAAARSNDPARYPWTRHMLDPVEFGRLLDLRAWGITLHRKRPAGRKKGKRDKVASFIAENYPGGVAGVTNKAIARDFENKIGLSVSERTVRRALGGA
jgi:hypothetical protein